MIYFGQVFTESGLLKSALNLANIVCYQRSKGLTRGTDEKTYWEFAKDLDSVLRHLYLDRYKFSFGPMLLVKRRLKNRIRDVYISNWSDRVVEVMLNNSINSRLRYYYHPSSYAYRPDRVGIDQCQHSLARNIKKMIYVVRRDIKNYFYTIDHEILLDKVRALVDERLFEVLSQRIKYTYVYEGTTSIQTLGIPFGSSVAGILANIYLTDLDRAMSKLNITYYRYADDIIFGSSDKQSTVEAGQYFDQAISDLKLSLSVKKCSQVSLVYGEDDFIKVNSLKFLGIEFNKTHVRLPIEKRRKIINFFKYAINRCVDRTKKISDINERLCRIIKVCQDVLEERIRSVAIIDYYLNHVNDEEQLKSMDRQLAEMVISAALRKKFKKSHFSIIGYDKLRKLGLESLLHRSRRLRHGDLKIPFISLYNKYYIKQYEERLKKRSTRKLRSETN